VSQYHCEQNKLSFLMLVYSGSNVNFLRIFMFLGLVNKFQNLKTTLKQGCTNFPKIHELSHHSRHQKDGMNQVPYLGFVLPCIKAVFMLTFNGFIHFAFYVLSFK
jgi:hypothetical protein